jgi:hypothetical protein
LDRDDYDVRLDPGALSPERALVFEVIGSIASFAMAADRIELEWLAEQLGMLEGVSEYLDVPGARDDEDDDEDIDVETHADDDFLEELLEEEPKDDLTIGRLYVGMPSIATYDKLRSLWNQYRAGKPFPKGHSDWWSLFGKLHDLRPWGAEDRVTPELRRHLDARETAAVGDPIQLEIDLWYRGDPLARNVALSLLKGRVARLGGTILDQADLAAVRYQAALVRLPYSAAMSLRALDGELALADEIMTVRPQSMFTVHTDAIEYARTDPISPLGPMTKTSLAALIDGYPVENHELLKGRLDVVEVDVLEKDAPVSGRFHGTAMASLIIHGDLAHKQPAIDRRLKIVPVLQPDTHGNETPPTNKLALAVIYRAVRDLKSGTGNAPPSGPDVILVNHSVCDECSPFSGSMSAWARTLDYLSFEYKILFVISAGNIRDPFAVGGYDSIKSFRDGDSALRKQAILLGLEGAKSFRTMLSPAESVNALTVGAAHSDGSLQALPATAVDPYPDRALANLGSGTGLGFNRAVKPDILLPGGRQVAQPTYSGRLYVHAQEVGAFGQAVASPGIGTGSTSSVRRTSGTSNAAALATRIGLQIADALDDTFDDTLWAKRPTAACMLKALIAHSGSWGAVGEDLDTHLPQVGKGKAQKRKENISRYLGYGTADIDRIISLDQHRITLLADGEIRANKRHEYRIPLPRDLTSRTDFRRITMTLAWLSPLRPGNANYRALGLTIVGETGKSQIWSGVKRYKAQPPLGATRRGTLMHMICDGKAAVPFDDDDHFVINVQTAAPPMSGLTKIDVPYALAVTFEVAASVNADIREEIRSRVQPRVRA